MSDVTWDPSAIEPGTAAGMDPTRCTVTGLMDGDPIVVDRGTLDLGFIHMTPSGWRRASFIWWRFVHNTLIHPLFGLGFSPGWLERAHDWTGDRCWGAG